MLNVVDEGGHVSPFLPPSVVESPLIEIEGIYVKLECLNPCGSVKDRIAAYILQEATKRGELKTGQTIVEATSGNTGISFAFYGRRLGHPVTVVMPEHMTEERKAIIRGLGATLILCSKEGSFAEAAEIRDRIALETGAFNPNQFANPLNAACHRFTTGAEIIRQVGKSRHLGEVAFVAGVGTGGTLIGVASALKSAWQRVTAVAVEPAEAAVMTGGPNGPHGIFGIGDGFIPEIAGDGAGGLHPLIDGVEVISTAEAMVTAKDVSEQYSMCVGVSSGANFAAARRLKSRFSTVITLFADGHQKYHTAGLEKPENSRCPFKTICARSELGRLLDRVASV
jgi:cysteine synthase